MTDFNADVREKKSIASGAKHRKGGSKSKKCTLPSDNLTAKEKKALNGDLHTLNFDKVYSIDELEIFSKQTQKEYLAYLAKHVCESLEEFCQFFKLTEPQMKNYMFGVNFKYTGPEKKATNSMSVREMITKAPLPEFKKIVVDGVTIPFDMTQLEARANVDTTENREIFCAMLKFVYTCRVSAYYVYLSIRLVKLSTSIQNVLMQFG